MSKLCHTIQKSTVPVTIFLTGVVLADLCEDTVRQVDLFGDVLRAEKVRAIYEQMDALAHKYGKHTVYLGSSHAAMKDRQHHNNRADQAQRKTDLFKGENPRQRIGIPMLGNVG